jgi:hypothetical protein
MGYVGNEPDANYTSFAQQTITGNGGTSYTLSHAVASGKEILLYINNVKQEEGSGKAYEATGTALTLSEAITSSDSCYCVFLGKALQTTVPPDGSVTSAKLANANLEMPNTLDMNGKELILDADADTSITADTDDQIDFKTAGADKMAVKADTVSMKAKASSYEGLELITPSGDGSGEFHIGVHDDGGSAGRTLVISRGGSDGMDTESMRIDASGNIGVNTNAPTGGTNNNNAGFVELRGANGLNMQRYQDTVSYINRSGNDGDVVGIQQGGSTEGTISVSGSTVSYNGFSGLHESSGIATNTAIGTVVSTIDELDVYASKFKGTNGIQDNPKAGQTRTDHAKVKISDTSGDKAVYGVVATFNEQGKVNVASVGIGSVRVTGACAKGDLLESNGDGTAKVQSDDIVRAKTIGKVTIGNSSTDVKLVSCVLYCG